MVTLQCTFEEQTSKLLARHSMQELGFNPSDGTTENQLSLKLSSQEDLAAAIEVLSSYGGKIEGSRWQSPSDLFDQAYSISTESKAYHDVDEDDDEDWDIESPPYYGQDSLLDSIPEPFLDSNLHARQYSDLAFYEFATIEEELEGFEEFDHF